MTVIHLTHMLNDNMVNDELSEICSLCCCPALHVIVFSCLSVHVNVQAQYMRWLVVHYWLP